jgi:hypothetical protein
MKWLMSLAAATMFCITAFGAESKFVTLGDISKIDAKNKSITVSDAISYNIAELGNVGSVNAGRGGGGGVSVRGGGGRRGGGGAPRGVRGSSAPIPMEFKVMISSKTVLKEGENDIKFEDLKVGDRLQVFSAKGGTKLEASEIIRTPKSDQ